MRQFEAISIFRRRTPYSVLVQNENGRTRDKRLKVEIGVDEHGGERLHREEWMVLRSSGRRKLTCMFIGFFIGA
jgi:hypothetical protein